MGWTNAGGREQLLSCIQSSVLITRFIALLSLLCGSLQKVTDTASLCLIISQLFHDLTLQMKNALCEVMQGEPQHKMTDVTFCCLVMLWLSQQLFKLKGKTHTIWDAAGRILT